MVTAYDCTPNEKGEIPAYWFPDWVTEAIIKGVEKEQKKGEN